MPIINIDFLRNLDILLLFKKLKAMSTITKSNHVSITAEPGIKEITIVREFNAERVLVFKAFTDPEIYTQWIGPNGYSTKIIKFEPRSGGSYRFIQKDPEGREFAFHGVYHEVLSPERIISTMEFEGLPEKGHVELDTTLFEVIPENKTRLTIQSIYQTLEDRDGMINSGMQKGVEEGFDRLEEILEMNNSNWQI